MDDHAPSHSTKGVDESTSPTPSSTTQKRVFKIIVVGDSCVGKTCLTFRFCEGRFPSRTEATIGVDFRERVVEVDGEQIKLQLWDTAGQERFRRAMVHHYYRNVHAVVFVYDVTNLASFESLPRWLEECHDHRLTSRVPRILVGNKADCDGPLTQAVHTNRAQCFADVHNMPLFETSAKDDARADHVESIFLTLAHKLKSARPMMWPSDQQQEEREYRDGAVHLGRTTPTVGDYDNNCAC